MPKPVLVLTVALDESAFQYFNGLRQQYFPPARNYLTAHLTLFHALPQEDHIISDTQAAVHSRSSFMLHVVAPESIGRGVAFKIESKDLLQLHGHFQNRWHPVLTAQDKQKLRPHITVQNKVTANDAQTLLAELKRGFVPFTATATGLQLWEYLGGPWRLLQAFYFEKRNG